MGLKSTQSKLAQTFSGLIHLQKGPAQLAGYPLRISPGAPRVYISHQMASLCNLVLRPPAAIPAKNPISNGAILRTASLILRTPPLFLTAKTLSRPPKAIPSQKYVYPVPIPEFAAAVSQNLIIFSLKIVLFLNDV